MGLARNDDQKKNLNFMKKKFHYEKSFLDKTCSENRINGGTQEARSKKILNFL